MDRYTNLGHLWVDLIDSTEENYTYNYLHYQIDYSKEKLEITTNINYEFATRQKSCFRSAKDMHFGLGSKFFFCNAMGFLIWGTAWLM